jgi:hypothetical protein
MNCKNCGLPIEEGEAFIAQYQTRWRHKSQDGGMTKYHSCAYANCTKEGIPDDKYSYPTVVATPDGIPDVDALIPGWRPPNATLLSLTHSEPLPVKVLPPVAGRRFR